VRGQVRTDNPVAAHLRVFVVQAEIKIPAEIAPISIVRLTIGRSRQQGFVVPVPDASALEARFGIHQVPKLEEVSCAIALGIGIFTYNDWAFFGRSAKCADPVQV
jgi:hypothetical protein